jgi:hypothetical protein
MLQDKSSRRDFIKKTAYAVPVVLTLKAMPAFAQVGSPGGGGNSRAIGTGGNGGGGTTGGTNGSATMGTNGGGNGGTRSNGGTTGG